MESEKSEAKRELVDWKNEKSVIAQHICVVQRLAKMLVAVFLKIFFQKQRLAKS